MEECIIYAKQGKKYVEQWRTTDTDYVHTRLMRDLMAQYKFKAPYIERITDRPSYHDDMRTVTTYYDNGCMAVYKIKF